MGEVASTRRPPRSQSRSRRVLVGAFGWVVIQAVAVLMMVAVTPESGVTSVSGTEQPGILFESVQVNGVWVGR